MGRSGKDLVSSRKADPSKQAVPQKILEERQFRALIQGVTDYAIYLLDSDGVIISWNAGALQILGYEARELLGEPFSRLFTREERRTGVPRQALLSARHGDRYEQEG